MQGNSVFRAAYAAIFLYFVRRTVRKVQPYRGEGGNRFCAFLPFEEYSVMVGSSNSLDKLMLLVSDFVAQKFYVEVYDRKSFMSRDYALEPSRRTGWRGWPASRRNSEKISIFRIDSRLPEKLRDNIERTATIHGQDLKTTTF